jgi:hypothetical protein
MLPTLNKTNNAEMSRASDTKPINKTPSITSPTKPKDQVTKPDEGDQSNSANESDKKSNQSNGDKISKNDQPESTQELKCDSKKVAQCERLGGGDRCYSQFNCTPLAYQTDYCLNFDPNKCLSYSGGVTCQQIFKNCQLFLSKVVPNQKNNSNLESNPNCQESKALKCLKKDGGSECFIENKCDKSKFQKEFCDGFNFSKCVSDNGGQACQKNHDACESFIIDNNNTSDNINRHNNFEGYLSLLTDTRNPNHPQNIGKPIKTCDETLRTSDQSKKPKLISSLVKEFEKFGKGVKTYSLGTYTREITDCSGFIMLAMRKLGFAVNGPQFDLNPNYPQHFKSCDPANLKPGDVLLLNYPGHNADHWIMVSGEGAWPSGNLEMMDVSSDYVDGKPFYSGKLNRRSNLRAREVYSCVRHRDF